MVSGFLTSPNDHARICSGLDSPMRIASKLLTSSIVAIDYLGLHIFDRTEAAVADALGALVIAAFAVFFFIVWVLFENCGRGAHPDALDLIHIDVRTGLARTRSRSRWRRRDEFRILIAHEQPDLACLLAQVFIGEPD